MKRLLAVVVFLGVCGWGLSSSARAAIGNRVGVGANYWKTLDDLDVKNFDDSGLSYYISYQLRPASLFGVELQLEMMPDGYGGSTEKVYAPQAYVILGGSIYVAGGIGTYYTDGEVSSDPFFQLRAGLDLHLLPYIWLDINAIYRFEDFSDIDDVKEDLSTDTIMLGGAVRLQF